MAGNSTITLQSIVDDAQTLGDTAPAIPAGGYSDAPALSIANDVMNAMILGGPNGEPLNWKWNRTSVTPFVTISLQQDYFVPGVVNVGWLESCFAVDVNNTSNPKPKRPVEVKRDLAPSDVQTGYPGKICWIPNDQCLTGTWGAAPLGPTITNLNGDSGGYGVSGLQNPGANVIYTNPVGAVTQPRNAVTAIKDGNGNFWALTTFGTCGSVEPTWPGTPVYPTPASPSTVATTQADGTCVWTAINPKGQGFRVSPIPPQAGTAWVICPIAQARPVRFVNLAQTLEPIPDDFEKYFKAGFFAQCYRRHPDGKVRAKFTQEWALFLRELDMSVRQGQREQDDFGFYPGMGIMDTNYSTGVPTPSNPYNY